MQSDVEDGGVNGGELGLSAECVVIDGVEIVDTSGVQV